MSGLPGPRDDQNLTGPQDSGAPRPLLFFSQEVGCQAHLPISARTHFPTFCWGASTQHLANTLYMCLYVYTYMWVCAYMYAYTHMYAYMCIHAYIHVHYICVYIHICRATPCSTHGYSWFCIQESILLVSGIPMRLGIEPRSATGVT